MINKFKSLQIMKVKEFIPPVKDEALNSNRSHASTTNVAPVWVSSSKSSGEKILVYALIDTQGYSAFIDERSCEESLTDTYPVKMTMMIGKDTIRCTIDGLRTGRLEATPRLST